MVSRQPRRNAIVVHESNDESFTHRIISPQEIVRPIDDLVKSIGQSQPVCRSSRTRKMLPDAPSETLYRAGHREKSRVCKPEKGGTSSDAMSRSVRFSKSDTVREYDPEHSDSLWWSFEELQKSRNESLKEIKTSKSLQAYLQSYERAYQQMRRECSLSRDNLNSILPGLNLGYRGVESLRNSAQRDQGTAKKVSSVVSVYHRAATGDYGVSAEKLSRITRSHAVALTAKDRRWAHVLGQADQNAASPSRSMSSVVV